MICDEYSAENEFISLSINSGGMINTIDKQTGAEYKNLLAIIDDSEFGDGWNHYSFVRDSITVGSHALIERTVNNVNTVSFKITHYLSIPEKAVYDCGSIKRSENRCELKVEHTVSLCKNEKWVRVSTVVFNNADDHRIRLKIPTGIISDTYKVNQAFCFVERSCGADVKTQDWHECEQIEKI